MTSAQERLGPPSPRRSCLWVSRADRDKPVRLPSICCYTPPMPVYTVTQIAKYVRYTVEADRVLGNLYITGEVTNFSRASSGHCYFTMKDGESQLRCVKYRDEPGEEHLIPGAAVTTHGRMTFYPARGDLQYNVDLVQPEGVGEFHMEFLRVKKLLEEEGLFDPARKRPLPEFPRRIAVVTSLGGAVVHDIQNILSRRYPLVELALVHSQMQGGQASAGVIAALRTAGAQKGMDLVILARGGGSPEELATFNREDIARAIYGCPIPVVSAIGHETDFTIADLVADRRAPTPSAAAEMVTPDSEELQLRIKRSQRSLFAGVLGYAGRWRGELRHNQGRLQRLLPDVDGQRQRVDALIDVARAALTRDLAALRERVQTQEAQLDSLHPGHTLARGYALVDRAADGRPVARPSDVKNGDGVNVRLSEGSFQAAVTGKGNHATPPSAPSS